MYRLKVLSLSHFILERSNKLSKHVNAINDYKENIIEVKGILHLINFTFLIVTRGDHRLLNQRKLL